MGSRIKASHARPLSIAAIASLLVLVPTMTLALDFRVDFRSSTYQAQAGDTFSDLLAQHESESMIQSTVTTGLADISTNVYASGVTQDYSVLLEASLEVAQAGRYVFQVGTDWGRGGATALIDNTNDVILSERVITDDIWWGYDWNNSDVFTTAFDFEVGDSLTLQWVGFEGCCGGSSTIRFSVDGGAFTPLTETEIGGFAVVPEPTSGTFLILGLMLLATEGYGRRN